MKFTVHCICFSLLLLLHVKSCHAQEDNEDDTADTPRRPAKPPLIDQTNSDPTIKEKEKSTSTTARRNFNELCQLCRIMYVSSDNEFGKKKNVDRFCIRLKQVKGCMSNLRKEKIQCNLFYRMVFSTGVTFQMRKHQCAQRNSTADDLENILIANKEDKTKGRTDVGKNCRYRQNNASMSELMHCGMFGDPHVKTFLGTRQTCIVAGTWSLLDNEYMSIQVTNEMVQHTERGTATATKRISIVFKERDLVCSREELYEATANHLPHKFKDGAKQTGPKGCTTNITKHSPDSVSIESCRSNTTILIRRVGKYLTFNILSPFEIVNKSSGLCYHGCPSNELVDYTAFFEKRIHQNEVSSPFSYLSNKEAMALCSQSNLTDFYYDSCVFDLLTTGDRQFSLAARLAMQDAQSMDLRLRLRRENSVVLQVVRAASMSSARTINHPSIHLYLVFAFIWCLVYTR